MIMVAKPFEEHEIVEVMSRLLDLEYINAQTDEALQAQAREGALSADMLPELPAGLLREQAQDKRTDHEV